MIRQWLILFPCLLVIAGCSDDMRDQPRYDTYESSDFFADGMTARPAVEGTVARGQLFEDEHLYTGKVDGKHAEAFPFPVTEEVLLRGQERYNIFCGVCHNATGDGMGMVVRRGFKQPASFHTERLQSAPPGYFFDVITNGFGAMYDYAAQVAPHDRWAIAAYIKALQLSQNMKLSDLPQEKQDELLQIKSVSL